VARIALALVILGAPVGATAGCGDEGGAVTIVRCTYSHERWFCDETVHPEAPPRAATLPDCDPDRERPGECVVR